jgi:triacylglycerol esterase/lipase EstA (alpha/beta hydrolase family)
VQEAAVRLLDSSHATKIDMVAYSMGALAARYFLQKLGGKHIVRRFVSISGPHHGTVNAWLRPGAGCRQMRPNSRFLQDLNRDPDPFGEVEVFSFYTPYDLMILPSRSSILNGARNHAFKVWLHTLMTFDHNVIEAVARSLAGDNPTP